MLHREKEFGWNANSDVFNESEPFSCCWNNSLPGAEEKKNILKFDDSAFTLNLQGFDRKYKEFPQPIEEKLNTQTCKEKNLIQ